MLSEQQVSFSRMILLGEVSFLDKARPTLLQAYRNVIPLVLFNR